MMSRIVGLDRVRLSRTREWIRRLPMIVFIVVILTFATWQIYQAVQGPKLYFEAPLTTKDFNLAVNDEIVIKGVSEKVAFLYLLGKEEPIFADDTFSYRLFVPAGYMVVDIKVADRYGREREYLLPVFNPRAGARVEQIQQLQGLLRDGTQLHEGTEDDVEGEIEGVEGVEGEEMPF